MSYDDLKIMDGTHYNTFKAVCIAHELYENDNRWNLCPCEAALMQAGAHLQSLFVMTLTHDRAVDPHELWEPVN